MHTYINTYTHTHIDTLRAHIHTTHIPYTHTYVARCLSAHPSREREGGIEKCIRTWTHTRMDI